MLNEEVQKYRDLSGDDNPNTPISRIGGYLDGYERALEQCQRMGRWKPYDGSWYECSECGAIREAVGYFENFCPNCGAKMSEIPTSCSTCILDNTDACTRGAGRVVDDEACEDYLASPTGAEGSEE